MTRKWIKQILEYLHILLVFAMVLPLIYITGMQRETGMIFRLYFLMYLLILPIMLIKTTARRCKKMFIYLLICAGILAGTGVAAFGIGNLFLDTGIVPAYVLAMLISAFMIALQAYSVRLNRIRQKKAKEEMDHSWKQKDTLLEKPDIYISFWFVCIYILAKNLESPEVCNLAFISTVVYLLVAVSYQFIDKTEEYLSMNEGVCNVRNIPYKRIFGIGKYFLFGYIALIALASIPAFCTTQYREYKDIREWLTLREVDYEVLLEQEAKKEYVPDPMFDVMDSYGEPKEMPFIVKIIFYGAMAIILLYVVYMAIKWIQSEMQAFEVGLEEEADKVESLEEVDEESIISGPRFLRPKTEEEKIRKEYRKFIRRHRKDVPAAYETPAEIEAIAGVAATPEGQELHVRYEQVRYGTGSQEDNQ